MNNTLIGPNAGLNITTQNNCICIGENTLIDAKAGDNQIRIGGNCGNGADVVILGADEKIWINRDIFESILKVNAEDLRDLLTKDKGN